MNHTTLASVGNCTSKFQSISALVVNVSGQVTLAIEPGMTYTHSKLYGSASKGSLCQDSYSWGWLTPMKVGMPILSVSSILNRAIPLPL